MKQITSLEKAHIQAEHIFRDLFPARGFTVRPSQIKLCHEMLDAMFLNRIALCDAGVGIGKTYAYLVAGLLWQKYRPRGVPMTLTVSTSSVVLQDAIIKEYIPFLFEVLKRDGILDSPIQAIIRKGRERYVCDLRLAMRQAAVMGSEKVGNQRQTALSALDRNIDLDKTSGLSGFDRAQVCVPATCSVRCPIYHGCRYQKHLMVAKSDEFHIQICNHNYLLADAMHRQRELRPLLKDYRILIVDEAHKLAEAARQMYGDTLAFSEIFDLCTALKKEHCAAAGQRLYASAAALAKALQQGTDPLGQKSDQRPYCWTQGRERAVTETIDLIKKAARLAKPHLQGTGYGLERAAETLSLFSGQHSDRIRYIQVGRDGELTLCAIHRDTPALLARDLWRAGKPAILTSGTLAAGGSFVRVRQQLGLEQNVRCREFTAPSPFDYQRNCLLYMPSELSDESADKVSGRLRQLLLAAHGHALVLFTSYTQMSEVCQKLKGTLPFPLLEAWRGNQQAVAQFKALPNAVLCAAGPCWEGVDFPGDMVSLLVLVRLPFPVPNPISEAEREEYADLREYIHTVVVPEMQTKLRQGAGRAIRTETDTCVIAILDKRAAPGARYHNETRAALPPCPVKDSLEDVKQFIQARKDPEYFEKRGEQDETKRVAGVGLCA